MRSRFPRHLRYLTVLIVLLGTAGVLAGTTGVLANTVGLPLGASAACGCEAAGFKLGPNGTEGGSLGAVEPGEEKEFSIVNHTGEEVTIESWAGINQTAPFELEFKPTTVNSPRCSVSVKLAVGALCYYRIANKATMAGGTATIKLVAKGTNTWRTEIEAF
jgi:hypothetical protein